MWATYPWVLLTRRPPMSEFVEPADIVASVDGVILDGADIARYAAMCGFAPSAGVPVTFPHVLAMPLHLKIFALRAFPLRPMGLIHLSNSIQNPGALVAGMRPRAGFRANRKRFASSVTCSSNALNSLLMLRFHLPYPGRSDQNHPAAGNRPLPGKR